MKVSGFLGDPTTRRQNSALALHFVADGDFDALQRVDVLGLGPGAEFGRPGRLQRHVGVTAHRTLVHPDIRYI
ncbi:Uncharacterised protein [Mycobacterium tuberculosis]|nr:Uncharacterised protein [Mycobacterium tuberculosis]